MGIVSNATFGRFCLGVCLTVGLFSSCFLYGQNPSFDRVTSVQQQASNGWDVVGQYGKIIKHTPLFLPDVTEPSMIFFLRQNRETRGEQLWERYHHYPTVSWQWLYARFGNSDIFGEGVGMVRSISYSTYFHELSLRYTLGSGIAYISRPYDRISNPTNNVIGSHWNNCTSIQVAAVWRLQLRWALFGEGSITHFSNARSQAPNLGINVLAAGAGVRYYLSEQPYEARPTTELPDFERPKWHLGLRLAYGRHSGETPWGPTFPIYVADVFVSKRLRPAWQLVAGVEGNYYESIRWFILNQVALPANEANRKALKISPYVGIESFFGRFSILFAAGFYAYNPYLKRQALPAKLGVQYYFRPTYERYGKQLLVGAYLRTHYANADYFSLGLGYLF